MNLHKKFHEAFERRVKSHEVRRHTIGPQITTSSTGGLLYINQEAASLLGVTKGGRLILFDMGVVSDDSGSARQFLLTRGFKTGSRNHGSKLSLSLGFSDHPMYNVMMCNNPDIQNCNIDYLVENGIGFYRKTPSNKSVFAPYQKLTATLELYTEMDENGILQNKFSPAEGVEPQEFFKLTDFKWKKFNYKGR